MNGVQFVKEIRLIFEMWDKIALISWKQSENHREKDFRGKKKSKSRKFKNFMKQQISHKCQISQDFHVKRRENVRENFRIRL